MPEEDLKIALNKLTEELQKIDSSDTESKELLKQLLISIELKLNEPQNQENNNQLLSKLKSETIHFEVKHPLISSTLEDIVAILTKLGL
jgi:hypothetical protein